MYWLSVGWKGGAEIAVEIREKRSSPKVGSGTNHRVESSSIFPKNMHFCRAIKPCHLLTCLFWDAVDSFAGLFDGFYYILTGERNQ